MKKIFDDIKRIKKPIYELTHDADEDCFYIKTNVAGMLILNEFLDEYFRKNVNPNFHEDWSQEAH